MGTNDGTMHVFFLKWSNCGLFRHVRMQECGCDPLTPGRKHSKNIRLVQEQMGIWRVHWDGHESITFATDMPNIVKDEVVVLPDYVTSIEKIEGWVQHESDMCPMYQTPVIDNVCGVLNIQNMDSIIRHPASTKVKPAFGHRFCIYSLYGNVIFDRGVTLPVFKGFKQIGKAKRVFRKVGMDTSEAWAWLAVFSTRLGRKLSVGQDSLIMKWLPQRSIFKYQSSTQEQNNSMFFKGELREGVRVHLSFSRHGNMTVRYFFDPPAAISDEILSDISNEIVGIMGLVLSLT
eukprot:268268-Rhodomonas_salina.3